jgi:phage recombination protein Bet
MAHDIIIPVEHVAKSVRQFDQNEIDLIKSTIAKGATDDELSLFIKVCCRTGLDPFARQIFSVKRWDSREKREVMTIQTSIDGFRLIAERSGKYTGQTAPQWCGMDGAWRDVWLETTPPAAARVGVLRSDFVEPCWGVARFAAYAQTTRDGGLNNMWAKLGDVMIAKCAESLALRKAFPQELSGLYTSDEMANAMDEAPTAPPPPRPTQRIVSAPVSAPAAPALTVSQTTDDEEDAMRVHDMALAVEQLSTLHEMNAWMADNKSTIKQLKQSAPNALKHLSTVYDERKAQLMENEQVAS